MRITYYTIPINCDLCGNPQSVATVSSEFGWNAQNATAAAYRAKHNIVDARCAPCEVSHGSFKEMTEAYALETGSTPQEAENFVIENPTKADFEPALDAAIVKLSQEGK